MFLWSLLNLQQQILLLLLIISELITKQLLTWLYDRRSPLHCPILMKLVSGPLVTDMRLSHFLFPKPWIMPQKLSSSKEQLFTNVDNLAAKKKNYKQKPKCIMSATKTTLPMTLISMTIISTLIVLRGYFQALPPSKFRTEKVLWRGGEISSRKLQRVQLRTEI